MVDTAEAVTRDEWEAMTRRMKAIGGADYTWALDLASDLRLVLASRNIAPPRSSKCAPDRMTAWPVDEALAWAEPFFVRPGKDVVERRAGGMWVVRPSSKRLTAGDEDVVVPAVRRAFPGGLVPGKLSVRKVREMLRQEMED